MRFVAVLQHDFAKWANEFGLEERNCNKENFTKVTETQRFFYTFGLATVASMGLVCADPSGNLLTSSVADIEKKELFEGLPVDQDKKTDALDEFLFDAEDSHGMNQEKYQRP